MNSLHLETYKSSAERSCITYYTINRCNAHWSAQPLKSNAYRIFVEFHFEPVDGVAEGGASAEAVVKKERQR